MDFLVNLILTMILYGAFPITYAYVRKEKISQGQYWWTCLGVNAGIMLLLHALLPLGQSAAYYIWALVFCYLGTKILDKRGVLIDGTESQKNATYASEYATVKYYCKSCDVFIDGEPKASYLCPKCHQHAKETPIKSADFDGFSSDIKQEIVNLLRKNNVISKEEIDAIRSKNEVRTSTAPTIKPTPIVPIVKPTPTQQRPEHTPIRSAVNPTPTPNTNTLFCRKCGARIPSDSVFCQKCGEKVVHIE